MGQEQGVQVDLRADLGRLARFGANIADAHSCFILLPAHLLGGEKQGGQEQSSTGGAGDHLLQLGGFHSFSNEIFRDCLVPRGSGLIGWVAKHNRSIHVSPFERDSRTLGTYAVDQQLKSFIGIPVALPAPGMHQEPEVGVIACDSRKAFAFSKVQGKLLEDLAREVSRTVELHVLCREQGSFEVSWASFVRQGEQLAEALGAGAVDVLRLRLLNFRHLEHTLGAEGAIQLVEQTVRLAQQSLPPHFPMLRLPNGDVLLVVDNMMTSFYENRIRALCEHVAIKRRGERVAHAVEFEYLRTSAKRRRSGAVSIAQLVMETNPAPQQVLRAAGGEGA